MNAIHDRRDGRGGAAGIYVDSIDRGPKGERGEEGKRGDQGEKGETGAGVVNVYVDDNDHLIAEMSNGEKKDAGEMPKVISRRVFVCEIDGTTNTIPLEASIKTERVTHLLINGLTYTDGFRFGNGSLILDFPLEEVPAGKLEIFANVHSRAGEVEIPLDLRPITEEELETILVVEGV